MTSPLFNEFTFSILHALSPVLAHSTDGWKAVDASLNALAERNPDFRVVFRVDSPPQRRGVENDYGAVHQFTESYLPIVSSKGLVKFEYVSHKENRFWKNRVLQMSPVSHSIPWDKW